MPSFLGINPQLGLGIIEGALNLWGTNEQTRRDQAIAAEEQKRYEQYIGQSQTAARDLYENLSGLIKGKPGGPGELATPGLIELYRGLTEQALNATDATAARAGQRNLVARDQTLEAQSAADAETVGTLQALRDATVGDYQKRMDTGMGLLRGLGSQEKADTAQRWANAGSAQERALVSRGLSGTTAAAGLGAGIERQKAADLARINQRLQEQQLNVYGALSGDVVGAKERTGSNVAQANINAAANRAGIMTDWARENADIGRSYDDQSLALRLAGNEASVQNQERLLTGLYSTPYQTNADITNLMAGREGPLNWAAPGFGYASALGGISDIVGAQAAARQAESDASKARRNQAWGLGINTGLGVAGIGADIYNTNALATAMRRGGTI